MTFTKPERGTVGKRNPIENFEKRTRRPIFLDIRWPYPRSAAHHSHRDEFTESLIASEFPGDDRLEYQLQSAQALHDKVQSTLNSECRAAEILARADKTMANCQNRMQEALSFSQRGTFLVGSSSHFCSKINIPPNVDIWGGGR